MEFDEALESVGDFGRFQVLTFALTVLPVAHTAIYMLGYMFTARDIPYRCFVPGCDAEEGAKLDAAWLSWTTPPSAAPRPWPGLPGTPGRHVPSACRRYAPARPARPEGPDAPSCSPEAFSTNETVRCDRWVFPAEERTIVSEFNMTCEENQWKLALVGSVQCMGHLVGMPLSGLFSDRFGRRTLLKVALALSWLCGLARSFASSYAAYMVFEFLDPLVGSGIFSACFILGVELVGARHRVLGSSLAGSFFALGCALLAAAAWWQRDWRRIIRVAYVTAALAVPCAWLLPESVRWLLARGRVSDAEKVMQRVADMNGVRLATALRLRASSTTVSTASADDRPRSASLRVEQTAVLDKAIPPTSQSASDLRHAANPVRTEWPLKQVCRSRHLMKRLLLTAWLWVINSFVYFGLVLRSVALAGDAYANFALGALVELPAYLMLWAVCERWGRRVCLAGTLALTGGSLLAFLVLPDDSVSLQLALYLVGKLAITASFTVLYVFTAELFPTNVRHSMIGVCSTVGRVGAALAPQTPLLEVIFAGLPLLLFGLLAVSGALLSLLLPETLNKALPDNVTQAEAVGRSKAVE